MGLRDRLNAALSYVKTPMTVSMLEQGSDKTVHVGASARVVVVVEGADDGTIERIGLVLRRGDSANENGGWKDVDLADVPAVAGRHEFTVTIPAGTLPSAVGFAAYVFRAEVTRIKGIGSDAVSPVNVVGRVEDLYWPDGPRVVVAGPADTRIDVVLDRPTADIGAVVTGRVLVQAVAADLPAEPVEIEFGAEVNALQRVAGHDRLQRRVAFKAAASAQLAPRAPLPSWQRLELPFSLVVEPGLPPTLRDGGNSVVWQLRVRRGSSSAHAIVGVLDPKSLSAPKKEQQTIASLFG